MDKTAEGDIRRFVCIHGHFYQPPRENPWQESLPIEASAAPFSNWNLRIEAECLGPNAASPILDAEGRVTRVLNNYSHISFNFGPTLLRWLENNAAETYRAILQADRESMERFSGHGSALAQAYNHVILPLAGRRDKEIQIRWGIRDFERRFGRAPEGFWLPETAVDLETLEVLAEHGIIYTILAPHQASEVRTAGHPDWVSAEAIDTRVPYHLQLPAGRRMNLFFYDGTLARAVAFEKLLHDGGKLAALLLERLSAEPSRAELSHIATDGETYGHHHRYGEMALSYALESIRQEPSVRLTNYGEFLEKFPPGDEVRIEERTSWSCSHGIQRWQDDCGCNSGYNPGWNQSWRKPLRKALEGLAEACVKLYEERGGHYFGDPEMALQAYGSLLVSPSREERDLFLEQHARPHLGGEERTEALRLLEMRRNSQLTFTSCAWFFDDLSGIEPTQILRYAARTIELAGRFGVDLEAGFLADLEMARSNLESAGNGRAIFRSRVATDAFDLARVAGHVAFYQLFDLSFQGVFPAFHVEVDRLSRWNSKGMQLCTGALTLERIRTANCRRFSFVAIYQPGGLFRAFLQPPGEADAGRATGDMLARLQPEAARGGDEPATAGVFDFRSLAEQTQHTILQALGDRLRQEKLSSSRSFLEAHTDRLDLFGWARQPLPDPLPSLVESILQHDFHQLIEQGGMELLGRRMSQARDWGVDFARDGWNDRIHAYLLKLARSQSSPFLDRARQLSEGLRLARQFGISLQLRSLQLWLFQESRRLATELSDLSQLRGPIRELADLLSVELPPELR